MKIYSINQHIFLRINLSFLSKCRAKTQLKVNNQNKGKLKRKIIWFNPIQDGPFQGCSQMGAAEKTPP